MVYLRDLPIYKNNSKKEPKNNSWDIGPDIIGNIPVIGPLFRSAAVTATDTTGLALKGLGAELKGIADSSDKSNNPDVSSSLYRGIGNFLNDAGTWLEGTTQTPKYEQYRPSEEWQNKDISDILSNSDTFSNYVTDPRGLRAELGGGLGSMLSFLALARLFPQAFAANAVKAPLDFTSNLLGRAGLDKAAQIVGGNAAKEFAGTGLQFATTMGPAGALVNAATIIDPLKEQGLSDSEIAGRMNELIAEELPADMAFAGLTGNVLKGQLGKFIAPRNSSSWRKALANAAGVPIEGLGGYYSNVNQAILSEKYSGQPYGELFGEHTPYEESAGRMGALTGIPFAAYGGVRGYREAQVRDVADRERVDNERLAEFNRRNTESKVRQATRDAIEDAFIAKQAEILSAAQYASARAKEKFGYDISPDLIYKQWAHEAGSNFDSENARYNNNFAGLTQTEPNGEENKQPDGNNYYRHFNNVREFADAYVDDFISRYPDISGVKNEREFANVLKKHGYFGDTVEHYASSMEGITVPSNQKNNNHPQVDIVSGLQSAKQSLDGKQMDNGTVGCVEAVTKILSHVHPEFKKMVDDGVVNTVEGENSLYSRLEKMGVEIIPFDESQVSQGDIIFYDGDQTFAHVLVADHIDEQGNWRVFGNSSSNNKVMEQPLYQGQTPSRIAKVSSFGDNTIQGRAEQLLNERNSPPEPEKPLFDINAEGTTTPKLIEQFLTDKATTALSQNDEQQLQFIYPLLNGNTFQDTPENRQAVLDRYGDELINYIQSNSQSEQPTQPQTPKTQTSQTEQSVPPKDKNQAIVQEGNRFLEELRQNNDQSKAQVAFQLQDALNKGNFSEVEKILNDNGRTIQQPQPAQPTQPTQSQQQQPVSKNKPPQNTLAQPEKNAQPPEAQIVYEAARDFSDRTTLAYQNGTATAKDLETLNKLITAIDNGASVDEIKQILESAGVKLKLPTQSQTPTSIEISNPDGTKSTISTQQILQNAQQTFSLQSRIQRALDSNAQQKAKEQELEDEANFTNEEQDSEATSAFSLNPKLEDLNDVESEEEEKQREKEQQDRDKAFREREEEKQRQAKQAKELGELQARQDEEKRLSEERQQETQRQENQRQENIRSSQKETIKSVLGISPNDTQSQNSLDLAMADVPSDNISRIQQGNAIAELLQRPQIKYAENAQNISKLIPSLKVGAKNAIIEGQRILNSLEAPIQRENKPTQVIRTPKTPEQIAQEQRQKAQKKAMRRSELEEKKNAQDNITAQQQNDERQAELSRNLDIALADVTNLPQDNLNQGGAILSLLNQPEFESENAKVSAMKGLKAGLARGNQNAIRKAQSILNNSTNDGGESYRRNTALASAKTLTQRMSNSLGKLRTRPTLDEVRTFADNAKKALDEIVSPSKYPYLSKKLHRIIDDRANGVDTSSTSPDSLNSFKQYTTSFVKGMLDAKEADYAKGNEIALRESESNRKSNLSNEEIRNANAELGRNVAESVVGKTQSNEQKSSTPQSAETKPNPNPQSPPIKQQESQLTQEIIQANRIVGQSLERIHGAESQPTKQEVNVKHSKQGSDTDTRIDNFVEDKDLTPLQKLLKSFGKMLGVKTVFFRNADGRFHGAHSGNTTYINVNSEMPLSKVFWHESLHWLKANNPELYKALVKAAGITTAQRQAYLEKTGRTDIKTPDEIDEEILADQFEDAAKRTGLFQSIAGKNRGLIQRVVQWLKDTMNKFIDHFRNPDGKLTTKQAQAFADEFGRIANQLKDPNGNKIFRYNRRTRNIELADGRKVEDFSFDEKETRENIARAEREGTLKYSVGNNNNSNKSLWHKAKNAMSSFFGFNTPEKRRRKIITENLRRLNRYRILYGYVDGADDVVVDNLQKLIKSRNAYDWEKLLPVVGEGIAKNLHLNATQAQSNYIADWLTTGALNNTTSPEAKAFEKAMRDNPAMGEILLETREIFKELANMDAWDSVKSTIAHRQNKTFWEKIKFFGKNFTEEVLDDLHPLQNIVDTAIKQAPPAVAEMIKRGVNVKQLAQIARGRGATADMMINGNADEIAKIRSELAAQYVGCYFDDFKTLKMIIKSVGGDWEGLEAFALAKLSKEMYEKNRTLSPKDEPYTPYMSEAKADHIINTGEAKFGEAQKDLVRFSKILAAMEYDAGVITDATFARYMKGWKEYVPTPRVWDENEDYNEIDFMKAKKGHTDDTWSPVQTIMANTHKIIQACERNKVKLELATLIRFGGFESNLSEVPTGNPDADNIIRFKENGKTKYLETPDPAIKRAIEAMHDKSEANWLTKTLRATAGFIRSAYTMLNPDFAAGNFFRDLPDAFIHNKQLGDTTSIMGMIQAWGAMFRALPSAFSEAGQAFWSGKFSEDFIEWQMNGGAQASFVSEDVDYVQRSIDNATMTTKQRWFGRGVPGFFSAALNGLQNLSELSENVTRLTSYKVAKANLAKAGKPGVTGKQLAALAAREASIDFSKAGRATRTLNKAVIFTNAAVQGINQWVEAFREGAKGNWKPFTNKFWRAVVNGVLVAALQALAVHFGDDDDKKAYEQAPDWEKETYWLFPAIGWRIPKGMDIGIRLFANLTDEAIGAMFDGKSMNAKRIFWDTAYNALPSLTATIVTPAVEVLQNYSYFRGAPIDPKSEQHLPAHMRYDETTSGIAKGFGEITGWSPRKIDYLINGYLGFMGRFLTHLPNYGERALRGEAPFSFEEFPITRRFTFTPYKNPKIVKEFYEAYDEQEQLYNEYKLTKERPDDYDAALHKRIKAAYEAMHKISKQEKTLLSTPDINHDELKSKLQALEKRRIAIAERVFQGAR